MKAEAPMALLSQTSHAKKTKGTAAAKALTAAAPKGKKGITPFWLLMSAKARTAETDGADSLKKSLLQAASTAVKTAKKMSAVAVKAEAVPEKDASPKQVKTAARKASPQPAAAADLVAATALSAKKAAEAVPAAERKETGAEAGKADAARAVSAKSPEPVIRVVDLRSKKEASAESVSSNHASKTAAPAQGVENAEKGGLSFAQSLSARRDAGPELPQRSADQVSAQPAAQTPLERLQEMAGSELSRAANIVLKDGGGEIRLVLKPESLGSVRIRMQIEDNAIQGTIIVDNSAVKHIVDGSIDALRRAFTAEGFQTGSLNVSVGGQNADGGARHERESDRPASVRRVESAQGFEHSIPGLESASMGDLLVNLFV